MSQTPTPQTSNSKPKPPNPNPKPQTTNTKYHLRTPNPQRQTVNRKPRTPGNALRLWTTLELTQDPILLAGFGLGLCANSLLLAQIIAFASRDRVSFFDLYTSDLRDTPSVSDEQGGV